MGVQIAVLLLPVRYRQSNKTLEKEMHNPQQQVKANSFNDAKYQVGRLGWILPVRHYEETPEGQRFCSVYDMNGNRYYFQQYSQMAQYCRATYHRELIREDDWFKPFRIDYVNNDVDKTHVIDIPVEVPNIQPNPIEETSKPIMEQVQDKQEEQDDVSLEDIEKHINDFFDIISRRLSDSNEGANKKIQPTELDTVNLKLNLLRDRLRKVEYFLTEKRSFSIRIANIEIEVK